MMRNRRVLWWALTSMIALPLGAQSVRGVVVTDSAQTPVVDALVTLLSAQGTEASRRVRTDSTGQFIIYAINSGQYTVRVTRLGYAPTLSAPLNLGNAQQVTLRLTMSPIGQRLATVQVTGNRRLSQSELMSSVGFDLRRNKYPMNVRDAAALADAGEKTLETLFEGHEFPFISVDTGGSLVMAKGRRMCSPMVYLDGFSAPLQTISLLRANMVHGIEWYVGDHSPPPSLAGELYVTGCGVVAIWTKVGAIRTATAELRPTVQVIHGRLTDFETDQPIAGATLTLTSIANQREPAVQTDSAGTFRIRTRHAGMFRMKVAHKDYLPLTVPWFEVKAEELVSVGVTLSLTTVPKAPLALVVRERPESYPSTAFASFDYRQRRQVEGQFLVVAQIARRGAASVVELLRTMPGVVARDSGLSTPLALRAAPSANPCAPAYFLNGVWQPDPSVNVFPLAVPRVRGVEVFGDPASVPGPYQRGDRGCGMIGLWTSES